MTTNLKASTDKQ